ncbi:hypothetical protein AVW11_08735 [Streptomyces amritsarensis]|uniref:Uncharacterized protein n=1 Tax=Streptomyces amritsarensis TaxID=681158 RepID=A0ABX3G9T9_9ACTN|nr:hypothetical protein [Streptomyces amritsarensis]OLZ70223.1 hypothetical protein AVW11_08735 [Streptomyces amritsarensis]
MAEDIDLLDRVTRFAGEFGVTGGYRTPTQAEKAIIVDGVSHLFDGNVDKARDRLAEVDYTLDTFTDAGGGRRFAEVSDAAGRPGSAHRGWGRVYVDLGAPPRWSVQVPHPVADQGTERLGARVLRGAPGGVMVMAGAHRTAGSAAGSGAAEAEGAGDVADGGDEGDPADMAHRTDSVFHAVVAELTRRGLPGIQLHGFADDSVPGSDSVVSTGAGSRAVPDAERLADKLAGQDVAVCRAWSAPCKLSGRTNEQGRLAARHGTRFLHVELSRTLRSGSRRMDETARAITYVTTGWSRDTR